MFFSEEEVVAILKKAIPKANNKDLANAADFIIKEGERWQEVDLDEDTHDHLETKVLHDICKRKSNSDQPPQKVRLFFK